MHRNLIILSVRVIFHKDGRYYEVDSKPESYDTCLSLFSGDPLKMAKAYYEPFTQYILRRKPDIVGHFDLITKFDEINGQDLLQDRTYLELAKHYMDLALQSDCIFEVNTGAMARGVRTSPYPCAQLLHQIKCAQGKITLSSDCHDMQMLDHAFEETKAMLREIGFTHQYALLDGEFKKIDL